jgi:hypothetical protein
MPTPEYSVQSPSENDNWLRDDGQIYMLLINPKSKKDDLTDRETALLREFVKEL